DAGVVRIGGGATAVSTILPKAIGDFRREHPDVLFEVREAGSREVERAVREESVELGLVTTDLDANHDADFSVQPLLMDTIVLVAGRGHPLAQRSRIAASQLEGLNLVGFEAGSAIRNLIDSALRRAGVKMSVVMELRSIAGILEMVETTRSLAFISSLGAPPDRTIAVRGLKVQRQLAVIAKKRRPLSTAASAFADALMRHAKSE
ncbi:MAG: LysR family transcriptional regulator substrate-binding protein, partial [Myxococcota bacterium]